MIRSLIIAIICLYAIAITVVSANGQTGDTIISTLPEPEPIEICPTSPLPPPITSYQEYVTAIGAGSSNCPDGFDETTFKLVSEVSDGNTCPVTIVRTYQIKDKCGMTATVEHVFIKNDLILPVLSFPYTITFINLEEANEGPIFQTLQKFVNAGGIAFDNCSLDSTTFQWVGDSELEGTECDGTIRRRYTVMDHCGNSRNAEIVFQILDNVGPQVYDFKRTITTECVIPPPYSTIDDFHTDAGIVLENYSNITLKLQKTDTISFSSPLELARTYELTDFCENTTTFQQSIIVNDQIAPTTANDTVVALMNGNISIQVLVNDMVFQEVIDSTTVLIVSSPEHGTTSVTSDGSIIYIPNEFFIGIDSLTYSVCNQSTYCGNMCDTATVFIEVKADNESPVIHGMLPAMQFECLTEIPVPFSSLYELAEAGITITDDFAIDSTSFHISEMVVYNNCVITMVRQYTISDLAQNLSTIEHTITIEDTQDPTLKCPPNVVLSLDHPVPGKFPTLDAFVAQGGSVSDNCEIDPGSFFNMSESIDTLSNSILIRRAYYVEDYCRNGDICLHQIEIETETNSIEIPNFSDFQVSVYPNPSNGQFSVKVEVSQSAEVQFEIVGMNGKTVYNETQTCTTGTNLKDISLQNLAPGTYMFKAKSGKDVVIEKVVVR